MDWILGLGGSDHDYSAALMQGTDVKVAIEAERVTRVKYGIPRWFEDPFVPCVDYCLEAEGVSRDEVTAIVSSDFLPQRTVNRWGIRTFRHHDCHAASAAAMLPHGTSACILVFDGAGSFARQAATTLAPYETFSFFEYAAVSCARSGEPTGSATSRSSVR